MDTDRRPGLQPLAEVVAFHHSRNGVACRQLDHAPRAERVAPLGVVADLGPGRVENQARLRIVSASICFDLLACQRRARGVATRRVADHRGEVTDQEDDRMAQILQVPEWLRPAQAPPAGNDHASVFESRFSAGFGLSLDDASAGVSLQIERSLIHRGSRFRAWGRFDRSNAARTDSVTGYCWGAAGAGIEADITGCYGKRGSDGRYTAAASYGAAGSFPTQSGRASRF